jgi:hypothetical protein
MNSGATIHHFAFSVENLQLLLHSVKVLRTCKNSVNI